MFGRCNRRSREREHAPTWYRTPHGDLVEAVHKHGHPNAPGGVWLTVEDAELRRHDYPARLLTEVHYGRH